MRNRSAERLSVLIAEDHAATRLGIRQLLLEGFPGAVVGEAGDARATLALLESHPWQLLILDLSLPDRHGLELLLDVKRRWDTVAVLVYSAHAEEQFGAHALRSGAAGYLTKERAPEELCHAVRTVLAGGTYFSGALPATDASRRPHALPPQSLSTRERQVLRLTVTGKPGKAIAHDLGLSQKTVSTYRARILKKLDLSSVPELVHYAIRWGLL
jgi:two-component system, NarL family, invasion response regulator UvrY